MIFRTLFFSTLFATLQLCAGEAPHIRLEPYLSGLEQPVALADDGSGRIFVVEQKGLIRMVENGQVLTSPYLDLTNRVQSGGECGLLCVVFHPQFAKNGRLFVNYTSTVNGHLQTFISEFKTEPHSGVVSAETERVIMTVDKPYANHNAGQIAFGPDGMLYIGTGDGGSGGDPHQNGQNLGAILGKILRIDVDHKQPYAVPADNPFLNKPGALPEIWAYGIRNPWRFSFDRETHQLYCGDVGQDKWEEVDILEKGKNYGWSAREGFHDFRPERANGPVTDPIKDYPHGDGNNCIIGGYVYRGKTFPALQGIYFYGDYGSGRIWGLKWDGHALTLDAELLHPHMNISSFGEDSQGNLYVMDYGGGKIYLLGQ
ncbi:MAG: PQQ-dependent sugar dehydrogenase [Chthoniobacteraceae bacterium]